MIKIDMHRWYALIYDDDKLIGCIGVQTGGDGLGLYEDKDDWEQVNG